MRTDPNPSDTFEFDGQTWAALAVEYDNDAEAEADYSLFGTDPPPLVVISVERQPTTGVTAPPTGDGSTATDHPIGTPSGQVFDVWLDNVDIYIPKVKVPGMRILVVYDFSGIPEYDSITFLGDPYNDPGDTRDWYDGCGHSRTYGFIESFYGVTWTGDGSHDEGFHIPALKSYDTGGEDFDSLFAATSRDYPALMVWDLDWSTRDLASDGASGWYVFYESEALHVPTGATPPAPKFYFLPLAPPVAQVTVGQAAAGISRK